PVEEEAEGQAGRQRDHGERKPGGLRARRRQPRVLLRVHGAGGGQQPQVHLLGRDLDERGPGRVTERVVDLAVLDVAGVDGQFRGQRGEAGADGGVAAGGRHRLQVRGGDRDVVLVALAPRERLDPPVQVPGGGGDVRVGQRLVHLLGVEAARLADRGRVPRRRRVLADRERGQRTPAQARDDQ